MPVSATADKTYWEQIAETSWGSYTTEIERRAIEFASSTAGPGGQALEIGCEGGRWSRLLLDRGWKMTCVDVDEKALRMCQAKNPEARCVLTSPQATSIPCEPASQRLLLCIEVRPVIQSGWFPGEAHRILEPGGLLVAVFWNRWSPRGLFSHLNSRIKGQVSFYTHAYLPWRRKLLDTGFELLTEDGCCWSPFGRDSDSRLVPVFSRLEDCLQLRRLAAVSPWIVLVARKTGSGA
jgi:SAM-dependent methyltransferase